MVLEMSFKVIEQYSYLDQTILEHFSLTTFMNPINRASRMNILVNSGIDLLFESRQFPHTVVSFKVSSES